MKGIADVEAGICGFYAHIEAEAEDAFSLCTVMVESDCPNIQDLLAAVAGAGAGASVQTAQQGVSNKEFFGSFTVDIMETMKHGRNSEFFKMVGRHTPPIHTDCAVIHGIYQAVKVACQVALPKDIVIRLEKSYTVGGKREEGC
jgi:hypothetical protein